MSAAPGPRPIETAPRRRCRTLQAIEHAGLVTGCLQSPQKPGAGVGKPLVVEVDWILCRQHNAQAKGPCLLQQREQRRLAWRIGCGGEVAKHLIHEEQRLQRRGAPLRPHPGDRLPGQERDEGHALGISQMRDRDHAHPRLPLRRPEQAPHIERLSLEPGIKARRGGDCVEPASELKAIGGRIEIFQFQKANALDRRRGDRAYERAEIDILSAAPEGIDDGRYQHMLAAASRLGVDARQRQNSGDKRFDPLPAGLGIDKIPFLGRLQALKHCQRPTAGAAGGIDSHINAVAQPSDPLCRLAAGSEAIAPFAGRTGGELFQRDPLPFGSIGFQPGEEIGWRQIGKREQHVGQIPLGIDHQRRNAIEGRLFNEVDQKPGFAAASHADADAMRGEAPGIDHQGLAAGAACLGIDFPTEVEHAEPLDIDSRFGVGVGVGSGPGFVWACHGYSPLGGSPNRGCEVPIVR